MFGSTIVGKRRKDMRRVSMLVAATCAFASLLRAALSLSTKPVRTFERPEGDVLALAFTSDGRYICAGGDRGVVYCWDADTGEIANTITAHLRAAVMSLATYPQAPFAAHASELGIKFHLVGAHGKAPAFPWAHRETGEVPTLPSIHRQTVLALDFSKDGDYLASGDRGGETIVWNLWTGEPYRRLQNGKDPVDSVRFHPDSNHLAVTSDDGKLRVWDTKANKMLYELAAHEGSCDSAAFSPDGKLLATGGKDKKIKLWNVADGKPVAVLEGHQDEVNAVAFHPKGAPFLASASDDMTVKLWDLNARKAVQTLPHENKVNTLAWSADGVLLATAAGKVVQVFEVK